MAKEPCPSCGTKVESIEIDRYRKCQRCYIEQEKK